ISGVNATAVALLPKVLAHKVKRRRKFQVNQRSTGDSWEETRV
ncbi:unnamed protein product, partial [Linum tenue]